MLILIVDVTHSWCNTQGYSENYNIVVIYCGVLAQYWMWIVLTAISSSSSSIIITEMMRKWRILAMNISFYPISFHFLPLNSHYFSRNTLCSLLICSTFPVSKTYKYWMNFSSFKLFCFVLLPWHVEYVFKYSIYLYFIYISVSIFLILYFTVLHFIVNEIYWLTLLVWTTIELSYLDFHFRVSTSLRLLERSSTKPMC